MGEAIVEMGEAMRSEPLNNCHSDEVTPIASSHSALIFSSCTAVPITFTFTMYSNSGMSSLHSALQMYCSDKAHNFYLQPREIQYSQCTSSYSYAAANTFTQNVYDFNTNVTLSDCTVLRAVPCMVCSSTFSQLRAIITTIFRYLL